MLLNAYVLNLTGEVNTLFDVVPAADYRDEKVLDTDLSRIQEVLRYDRQANVTPGPGPSPSQDPSVVRYIYKPSRDRQALYAQGFPINMENYEILDAFVCMGSRFGLSHLQVYVELCKGCSGYLWTNIYYVADSLVPAVVIRITRVNLEYPLEEVKEMIRRDEEQQKRFEALQASNDAEMTG